MNAKAKFLANEQRDELFQAADYRSVVSGRPLSSGVPQLAHRVPKSKANLEKWGPEVINNPLNLVPVLDLRENDRVNIGNRRQEARELMERIVRITTGRESMPNMREFYRALRGEFASESVDPETVSG